MKTVILTHADADGICAGAISKSMFPKASVFFTKPVSFLKDLEDARGDRFVISDIALNKRDAPQVIDLMAKKGEVIYLDHHPIPPNMSLEEINKICTYVHNEEQSASEIAYMYFEKEIPRERIWAAIYGGIADYTETDFIRERMRNWDIRALYFEVSTLVLGIKMEEFTSYDSKRNILEVMARGGNPSDVFGLVNAAKVAVSVEFDLYNIVKERAQRFNSIGYVYTIPSFGFRGPAALFAATVTDSPVGMCLNERRDHLDITVRARETGIPLNKIMESSAEEVGGSGGGLEDAAGGRIAPDRFKEFLGIFDKKIKEIKRTRQPHPSPPV